MDIIKYPKAEVHYHLTGAFVCETIYEIFNRNGITPTIPIEEYKNTQSNMSCLDDLLKLIFFSLTGIQSEQDVFDLALSALSQLSHQNIVYVEPAVSIKYFMNSSISPSRIISTLDSVASNMQDNYRIKVNWLLEFGRAIDVDEQINAINSLYLYKDTFKGIGLSMNEYEKSSKHFSGLFEQARNLGYCGLDGKNVTVHTGEETPPCYIKETLEYLNNTRIDHGVRAFEDIELMKKLGDECFPIAMSPLSNKSLKIIDKYCGGKWVYQDFIDCGCMVSLNSDDPGPLNKNLLDNFQDFYNNFQGDNKDKTAVEIIKNGFRSSFMPEQDKADWIKEIDKIYNSSE